MKKFIVVFLAAVLALSTVAFAAPSPTNPGGNTPVVNPTTPAAPAAPAAPGAPAGPAAPAEAGYASEDVDLTDLSAGIPADQMEAIQDVVDSVNALIKGDGTEAAPMSVEEAAELLNAVKVDADGKATVKVYSIDPATGKQVAKDVELDLSEYSFVSEFKALTYKGGFKMPEEDKTAVVNLRPEVLKGMTDAKDLEDYMILVIDGESGEAAFIELTEKDVVSLDPIELKVEFPFLGLFAFIQK